jgi:hypothetical protein
LCHVILFCHFCLAYNQSSSHYWWTTKYFIRRVVLPLQNVGHGEYCESMWTYGSRLAWNCTNHLLLFGCTSWGHHDFDKWGVNLSLFLIILWFLSSFHLIMKSYWGTCGLKFFNPLLKGSEWRIFYLANNVNPMKYHLNPSQKVLWWPWDSTWNQSKGILLNQLWLGGLKWVFPQWRIINARRNINSSFVHYPPKYCPTIPQKNVIKNEYIGL